MVYAAYCVTEGEKMIEHPIPPTYDEGSRILILGSFPSVKSREQGYFYGHPQNRFWQVLAAVFEEKLPISVQEKQAFLKRHRVAVWDVIASCEIEGSSDSSIRNVRPNDLSELLRATKIRTIYVNGKKAEQLYKKYMEKKLGIRAICLPSTSPANAVWKLPQLIEAWQEIRSGDENSR